MKDRGKREIRAAYEGLEQELPGPLRRPLHWLRKPRLRYLRWPVGLLLIGGGTLWFLPVIGIEWLPLGLLLIAQDVPLLRRPVGRMMLTLEGAWRRMKRRWRRWRAKAKA